MKKLFCLAALASMLLVVTPASADSSYKRSRWASRLDRGVLKVQGPGYGSWGKRWTTVASRVKSYREVGTSKGPVLVYTTGRQWTVVQLRFNTGAKLNPRHFNQPVTIIRGGRYGALLRVGKVCYDYSWQQLRKINCKTGRFR